MSATDEEEARAEAWLGAQGYTPSRPTWLPGGRNPDFWAENANLSPPYLWVEVKTIELDDATAAMVRFSDLIKSARIPSGLRGHALMEFESHAIEQSIQWVLKRAVARSAAYTGKKVSLLFLQQTRDSTKEYRIEIDAEPPIVVWARAQSPRLNAGIAIKRDVLHAIARVRMPDGSEISGPVYQFFGHQHPMQCALMLRLDPEGRELKDISYMSGGDGQTRERTVRALENANSQIKAACVARKAPGLVILTPRGPFHSEEMMQAAIYGQYTIPLRWTGDQIEQGDMYHGPDGVFRHDKNTHISAAVHVRRRGPATFFPNPYALHPIHDDAPVFSGAIRADIKFV